MTEEGCCRGFMRQPEFVNYTINLKSGEKIDKYLKDGYSTISLGYVGVYEATMMMKELIL